eukprot:1913515-Prymnesium_polylepis.2
MPAARGPPRHLAPCPHRPPHRVGAPPRRPRRQCRATQGTLLRRPGCAAKRTQPDGHAADGEEQSPDVARPVEHEQRTCGAPHRQQQQRHSYAHHSDARVLRRVREVVEHDTAENDDGEQPCNILRARGRSHRRADDVDGPEFLRHTLSHEEER